MTKYEIKKALRFCTMKFKPCRDCPFYGEEYGYYCKEELLKKVLSLIEKQDKELEEYPTKTLVGNNCEICSKTSEDYDNLIADIKSEAIEDFTERLKKNFCFTADGHKMVDTKYIDNLVKEITKERETISEQEYVEDTVSDGEKTLKTFSSPFQTADFQRTINGTYLPEL